MKSFGDSEVVPGEIVVPRQGKDSDDGPVRILAHTFSRMSGAGIQDDREQPKATLDNEGGWDGTPQA